MAITAKHYREVAEIIREQVERIQGRDAMFDMTGEAEATLEKVADGLARMFSADNSNFRRDQFMEACGL